MRWSLSPQAQRTTRLKKHADSWMLEVWAERGQEPPASFFAEIEQDDGPDDAPELDYLERRYFDLFNQATTCRPVSMGGALPIPITAIWTILDRNGFEGTEGETALMMVRLLDSEILQHYADNK